MNYNKTNTSSGTHTKFIIAFTERHGMAMELCHFPPQDVEYSFIDPLPSSHRIVRSSIKGYLGYYESKKHDIIEAILSPVLTKNRWIYSLANFQEATSFNFIGFPLPRKLRIAYINNLLLKNNFKKLIFWSNAGINTLHTYGECNNKTIVDKATVVYPAIREVHERLIQYNNNDVTILFSGDFFRKGGANVVDAFEMAQNIYPNIKLRLCCDENIDFYTKNDDMRNIYIKKIKNNRNIIAGRVDRNNLINDILPNTDIYLLPTYVEAFGFAILEAMAYGIPVISTNYFAIPEMVDNNINGLLIDTKKYNCELLFKGYIVDKIPSEFNAYMTDTLFKYLCQLIESPDLRLKMGQAGLRIARTKFSFEIRNKKMVDIYREALA